MFTWMLPSPACPNDGIRRSNSRLQPIDQREQLGDPAARHHDIVVVLDRGNHHQRERQLAADPPQLRALRVVPGATHFNRLRVTARALDALCVLQHGGGPAVHFEQQNRAGSLGRERPRLLGAGHGLQRIPVDQFQRSRHDPLADDVRHRPDCAAHVAEAGPDRRLDLRPRHQPEHDVRDHGERALRSHEQVRQVVADDVLHDLPAGLDDLTGRQDRLQAEDVVLGRSVLERARPAGALGDVAANRRLPQRRGIGGIEQPDAFHGILKIASDDVGLDDGEQVCLVYLEDAIHPLE